MALKAAVVTSLHHVLVNIKLLLKM